MKKISIVIIFFFLSPNLKSQDALFAIISKVNLSMAYKSAIVINNPYHQLKTLDTYIGYKFKNQWSLGLNTGYSKHNDKIHYYNTLMTGVGFKYFLFHRKNFYDKAIGLIPYINFNYAMTNENTTEHDYIYYDMGINIVYPKFPLLFVGMGLCQNFYFDNRNNLISGYLSVGFRF